MWFKLIDPDGRHKVWHCEEEGNYIPMSKEDIVESLIRRKFTLSYCPEELYRILADYLYTLSKAHIKDLVMDFNYLNEHFEIVLRSHANVFVNFHGESNVDYVGEHGDYILYCYG